MSVFEQYVKQILSEQGMDGMVGNVDSESEGLQSDQMQSADTSPTPEMGATSDEQATFDKPYKDLAKIAYKALRIDFDTVPKTYQDRLLRLDPENTNDNNKGVEIFKTLEDIVNDMYGVESEQEKDTSDYGPAV